MEDNPGTNIIQNVPQTTIQVQEFPSKNIQHQDNDSNIRDKRIRNYTPIRMEPSMTGEAIQKKITRRESRSNTSPTETTIIRNVPQTTIQVLGFSSKNIKLLSISQENATSKIIQQRNNNSNIRDKHIRNYTPLELEPSPKEDNYIPDNEVIPKKFTRRESRSNSNPPVRNKIIPINLNKQIDEIEPIKKTIDQQNNYIKKNIAPRSIRTSDNNYVDRKLLNNISQKILPVNMNSENILSTTSLLNSHSSQISSDSISSDSISSDSISSASLLSQKSNMRKTVMTDKLLLLPTDIMSNNISSNQINYFTDRSLIEQISTHLFQKKRNQYTHLNKKENLINLTTFAICSKNIYHIVFKYIKKLVLFYENNLVLLENECFNIFDEKDGIKILMAMNLANNSNYMYLLGKKFQYAFEKYLNDNFSKYDSIHDIISTLNVISKINIFKELFNLIISYLSNIIFDDFFSWSKKYRVVDILIKLEESKYFNNKTLIVTEIIDNILIRKTLVQSDWESIFVISKIIKKVDNNLPYTNIVKKILHILDIPFNDIEENILRKILSIIDNILLIPGDNILSIFTNDILDMNQNSLLFKIIKLLNHPKWIIVNQSLSIIINFIKMTPIDKINTIHINTITFKLKEILVKINASSNFSKWKLIYNILIIVNYFAKNKMLKELDSNVFNDIFIIVKGFLYDKKNPIIGYALEIIGNFATMDMIKKINIITINEIMIDMIVIIRMEMIATSIKWATIYNIINVVNNFCKSDILNTLDINITEEILIIIKIFLYKNQPYITKCILTLINNIVVSGISGSIGTQSNPALVHQGIIKKINPNIVKEIINYISDSVMAMSIISDKNKSEIFLQHHSDSEIIILLSNFSKTGMLNGIEINVIENILIASRELLLKKEIHIALPVVNNILYMIGNFASIEKIEKINIDIIKEILIETNKLLSKNGHYFTNNIILMVYKIIESELINKIPENIIEKFLLTIKKILYDIASSEISLCTINNKYSATTPGNIIINTIFAIKCLVEKNMLENIDNEIIRDIIIPINKLLSEINLFDISYTPIGARTGFDCIDSRTGYTPIGARTGFDCIDSRTGYTPDGLELTSVEVSYIILTIGKLVNANKLDNFETDIMPIIYPYIELLLDSKDLTIIKNVLIAIHQLTMVGVLNKIEVGRIDVIFSKIIMLLEWVPDSSDLAYNILIVISTFSEMKILYLVDMCMIKKILIKIEKYLKVTDWKMIASSLFIVRNFIERNLFNSEGTTEFRIIENIVNNVGILLCHNKEEVVGHALFVLGKLIEFNMLNKINPKMIFNIITNTENLLNHNDDKIIVSALFVMGNLAQIGVLKNNISDSTIKKILFRSKELLYNELPIVVYHTKCTINKIIEANILTMQNNKELKNLCSIKI